MKDSFGGWDTLREGGGREEGGKEDSLICDPSVPLFCFYCSGAFICWRFALSVPTFAFLINAAALSSGLDASGFFRDSFWPLQRDPLLLRVSAAGRREGRREGRESSSSISWLARRS